MTQSASQQISIKPPILEVRDLSISFSKPRSKPLPAVHKVSWSISPGEILALVGESGSGKSVSSLAVMGLLPKNAQVQGSIRWQGRELLGAPDTVYRQLRGNRICLVPQDPMASLNPVYTIGYQIRECLLAHGGDLGESHNTRRIVELLEVMGIPRAAERANSYPHELSGGMRQRVVIAMALANSPDLIIADEATTALDVTVQAQVLESLTKARELTGAALLLITHDLGVVAGHADRVAVMRHGEIVENDDVETIFYSPSSAYTRKLLESVPRLLTLPDFSEPALDENAEERHPSEFAPGPNAQLLLSMKGVEKEFGIHSRTIFRRKVATIRAVAGVDLSLRQGQTLAIVGESGSGKSTLIRTIFNLDPISRGQILFEGKDIHALNRREMRAFRSSVSMVFQDPYASLNPMMTVRDTLVEPAILNGMSRKDAVHRAHELLYRVRLLPEHAERYPNEFSGGQRQRIAIARALMSRPKLVVLDEPVSSLDVSIQAEVLGLLRELQREFKLSYLFVSHDLSVVASVAHHVAVMYFGRIVERGTVDEVYSRPRHPYTRALLSAIPVPDPRVERARQRLTFTGHGSNSVTHEPRGFFRPILQRWRSSAK